MQSKERLFLGEYGLGTHFDMGGKTFELNYIYKYRKKVIQGCSLALEGCLVGHPRTVTISRSADAHSAVERLHSCLI